MSSQNLCSCVTIILADEENTLCYASLDDTNVVTLHVTKVPPNAEWSAIVEKEIHELLGSNTFVGSNIYKMVKIWLPAKDEQSYIVNTVVLIKVSTRFKGIYNIPKNGRLSKLKWLNIQDLVKFYSLHAVNTPILLEIFPKLLDELKDRYHLSYPSCIQEAGCYIEMNSDVFGRSTDNVLIDDMVENSPWTKSQEQLYLEFLKLTYPDLVMSGGNFVKMLIKLGFTKQEANHLFRAADLTNRGFITFAEFFAICIAVDTSTKHIGVNGKARAAYIFRYLDKNNDGKMSLRELRDLVILLRRGKKISVDSAHLEMDLKDTAKLLGISASRSISSQEFIKIAADSYIKGIGNILRSVKSLSTICSELKQVRESQIKMSLKTIPKTSAILPSVERSVKNNTNWNIATNITKIMTTGSYILLEPLFNDDSIPESELDDADITIENRRESLENISEKNICNELVDLVRELANLNDIKSGNRGKKFREYRWGHINQFTFAQKLLKVCSLVLPIFKEEPRVLKVQTPVYLLGDFHGNFGDLLYFEQVLWHLTPAYSASSFLFLGDYVDRGWYSLELISYLFSHKIQYPNKIFMVRGNHEIRAVQQMFTFHSECASKFGESQGRVIWETINCCFDYMPVAAILDEQIFCCHGGIPPPWLCPSIDALNNIPKPLPNPDIKSPLAWEILWNDPIKDSDINKEIGIELSANDGFAQNLKRGTGHVFSYVATKHFLKTHNFTHIIRAHEMAKMGFSIFHQGRVISVFSSSKYNNNNNESACILAENFSFKAIRLNPSNLIS